MKRPFPSLYLLMTNHSRGGQEFSENSLCADVNSTGERCRWRRNREGSRAMWAWDDIGGEGGVEKYRNTGHRNIPSDRHQGVRESETTSHIDDRSA